MLKNSRPLTIGDAVLTDSPVASRIARVIAINADTVDVLPMGSSAVLHDIPVSGTAAVDDYVTLQTVAGRKVAIAGGPQQFSGESAVRSSAIVTVTGVGSTDIDAAIAAHAAISGAHHSAVTAGNTAISVAGQAVSVALATTSGLAISSGLMLDDAVAGNGLAISSKVLSVAAADTSLTINASSMQVRLATTSGLAVSSGLMIDDAIAGDGLAISSKVLSIAAADTSLTVNASSLQVRLATNSGLAVSSGLTLSWGTPTIGAIQPDDTADYGSSTNPARSDHRHSIVAAAPAANSVSLSSSAEGNATSFARSNHTHSLDVGIAPTWTALHTFNLGLDVAAGQAVTTPTIDATAALTLQPTGNLILDPVTNVTAMASGVAIQSSAFASQTTGWRITDSGDADFRYLFVDEMHAKAFIADLEQALAGGQIICKSVAKLAATFTAPAAGGATTITVESFAGYDTVAVFANSDLVGLRNFTRTAGALSITNCWGTVTLDTTYGSSGYDAATHTQRYNFTRSSGTIGANNAPGGMAQSATVGVGALVLDYGTTGNGYYEVNAIDGASGVNSPYSQTVKWVTHPGVSGNRTVTTRTGNLNGVFGTANEYGMYAGDGATGVTARYVRISSAAAELRNLPLALYDGTNNTMLLTAGASNNSPSLAMGATLPTGPLTNDGLWMGKDSSDYEFRVGTVSGGVLTKGLHWDGSSLNILGSVVVGPGVGFTAPCVMHLGFTGTNSRNDFRLNAVASNGVSMGMNPCHAAPGMFGKCYSGGEAVTNLVTNPSVEVDTTEWTAVGTGTTVTRITKDSFRGTACAEIAVADVASAGVAVMGTSLIPATAGSTYTASIMAKCIGEADHSFNLIIRWFNGSLGTISDTTVSHTMTSEWELYTATGTAPANTAFAYMRLVRVATGAHTWRADCAQFSASAYAKGYVDGSLGSGYSWSGTANSSTSSTSSGSYLSCTTPQMSGEQGSVSVWVYNAQDTDFRPGSTDYDAIFECNYGSTGVLLIVYHQSSVDARCGMYAGSGSKNAAIINFTGRAWHHIVGTWSPTDVKIYYDGELAATRVDSTAVSLGTDTMYVGAWDGIHHFNGLIDDLVLFDRVLSADEVAALYGGGSPKPFIPATSPYGLTLTGPDLGRVVGNSSGLFGYSAAGAEAFALVTTGVTWGSQYSGGSALAAGDLVLGDPDARHLFYDASAGTLAIKSNTTALMSIDGSGNATFQGAVKATSGYIGGTTSGWTITTDTISASGGNLQLFNGNSTTTNITAGTSTTAGGLSSAATGTDVIFWAGETHSNRGSAAFKVTAAGALTATSATITGTITANAGYVGGTSGWTINSGSISATGITLTGGSGAAIEFTDSSEYSGRVKWTTSGNLRGYLTHNGTSTMKLASRNSAGAIALLSAEESSSNYNESTQLHLRSEAVADNRVQLVTYDGANVRELMVCHTDGTYGAIAFPGALRGASGHYTWGGTPKTGALEINTVDNTITMYADGAWRTLASW